MNLQPVATPRSLAAFATAQPSLFLPHEKAAEKAASGSAAHAVRLAGDRLLQMNVGDYFTQGRRGWIRLHEKGTKEHEAPCHHKLETYLDEYIAAAAIADDAAGPLFRTTGNRTRIVQRMGQPDAYRMIERRAKDAGIKTKVGNHSLRATGITDYLKSDGTPEHAQAMANHSSPRTTNTTGATMKSYSPSTRRWGFRLNRWQKRMELNAAARHSNGLDEPVKILRLSDVADSPERQRTRSVGVEVGSGKYNNRDAVERGRVLNCRQNIEAIKARHVEIEENRGRAGRIRIAACPTQESKRFLPICNMVQPNTRRNLFYRLLQHVMHSVIIIHAKQHF